MERMIFYFFSTGVLAAAFAVVAYAAYVYAAYGVQQARLLGRAATVPAAPVTVAGVPEDRTRLLGQAATMFAGIATVALVLHLIMFAAVAGRAPWSNQFEFATSFATAILVGNLWVERHYGDRRVNLFIVPIALALLLYAWTLPDALRDPTATLIPALQNNFLLTIHVSAAVAAYGVFAIAFAGAVVYLAQGGDRNRVAWLPEARLADDLANKAVMVGVPLHALVLMLGAWWASIAWSRAWAWDPKETAALVTFLIYVLYLHTRNQRGWRGTPSAIILIMGFGATLFTFFGNYFLGGLHTYSGL